MLIPRPPAVGDPGVVQELRAVVISEPILGGASARAKRLERPPWRNALFPRPHIYIAVTPGELRLFSKMLGSSPYEIGRWRNRAYQASLTRSRGRLKLDLELERLGRVTLLRGPFFGKAAAAVFDLVVQNAGGPVRFDPNAPC